MRARDATATSVLRTTLSAIANAEAVEVPAGAPATELPRRELTERDVDAIVRGEHDDLITTAAELRSHGRRDEAAELDAKAAVLRAELTVGDAGGDPACWLHELCPDCGAVPDAPAARCWRCGYDVAGTA
ncbi:MAG: uncharacterized protein QOD30_1805 [Actinomycetota bacterium]|nr:uncharacterized protein [Actinomycetota bacterium]